MNTLSKHKKYEASARRGTFIKVSLSKSDDKDEWEKIKTWLQNQSDAGELKDGLYQLAIKHGVLDK